MNTRESIQFPFFGSPEEVKESVLPTYSDVIKYYNFLRLILKSRKREPPIKEILEPLVTTIEKIWKLASIPTVSKQRIIKMFKDFHSKYPCYKKCAEKRTWFD